MNKIFGLEVLPYFKNEFETKFMYVVHITNRSIATLKI